MLSDFFNRKKQDLEQKSSDEGIPNNQNSWNGDNKPGHQ
jgi:hypothetical protein